MEYSTLARSLRKTVLLISLVTTMFFTLKPAENVVLAQTCKIAPSVNIRFFSFSPDEKYFVVNTLNAALSAWDIETGKLIQTFPVSTNSLISNADISRDSHYLAAVTYDGDIVTWA